MENPCETAEADCLTSGVAVTRPNPMKRLWTALLPELRRFAEHDRDHALALARMTPVEVLELVGLALGLVGVTALARYVSRDLSAGSSSSRALVAMAVALPLVALALSWVHVRRLRRGLRLQLQSRGRP